MFSATAHSPGSDYSTWRAGQTPVLARGYWIGGTPEAGQGQGMFVRLADGRAACFRADSGTRISCDDSGHTESLSGFAPSPLLSLYTETTLAPNAPEQVAREMMAATPQDKRPPGAALPGDNPPERNGLGEVIATAERSPFLMVALAFLLVIVLGKVFR